LIGTIAAGLSLIPQSAKACAACFGRSDSALAKGMNMGILSLLVVVVFMWIGFAAFFVYLARKSAAISSKKNIADVIPETTNSVR
jgi:uncharacterized BrkB/YihY/UPF0761 family membrane protein